MQLKRMEKLLVLLAFLAAWGFNLEATARSELCPSLGSHAERAASSTSCNDDAQVTPCFSLGCAGCGALALQVPITPPAAARSLPLRPVERLDLPIFFTSFWHPPA